MNDKTWADQWSTSLGKHFLYEHLAEPGAFSEEVRRNAGEDGFQFAREAVIHRALMDEAYSRLFALEDLESVLGSPIETAMLSALIVVGYTYSSFVVLRGGGVPVLGWPANTFGKYLIIDAQAPIGKYKADFLLTIVEPRSSPLWEMHTSRAPLVGLRSEVVIECDGHAFHEKTAKQASHDKKRDREMQKLGFHVFRYSGSDIWGDVVACAEEAVSFANDRLRACVDAEEKQNKKEEAPTP